MSIGYCPHCGRELTGLTVAARGYCEEHGWQWADWTPRKHDAAVDAYFSDLRAHAASRLIAHRGQRTIGRGDD